MNNKIYKLILLLSLLEISQLHAQVSNTGCLAYNFGIDAGLFSNIIEFGSGSPAAGSKDWFFSAGAGLGIIDETNPLTTKALLQASANPTYERRMNTGISSRVNNQLLIDAVWARDNFGGTGGIDLTSFNTASKNGEDPAIWDPGPQNVLGKNDLIDVAGHMFREGPNLTNHLWFTGLINRAEPGGDAYMDFEFFIEKVTFTPGIGFSSGGPELGHTAFTFSAVAEPDGSHRITKIGDFLFNMSLTGGGVNPGVEVRLWVSYADYSANRHPAGFTWGPEYDGAFNGSPYGYASIVPTSLETVICGIVNTAGQKPAAPPWGTKNTKSNSWATTYNDYSVMEVGLNMTHFGIDHVTLLGADPCSFPIHTFIVKTRASNSFTAQLKDFAGPFGWGQVEMQGVITGSPYLSCASPTTTLTANPDRVDVAFNWTTVDGQIDGASDQPTVTVSKPGTYTLHSTLQTTNCPIEDAYVTVGYDPLKPLINTLTATSHVSCSGGSSGSIDLTVSGGTPPYTYLWSNGATVEDPTGLAAGTYSVTVTDALLPTGCSQTLSGIVVGAGVPTVITFTSTPATCNGNANGSIDATVTGKSPFTYSWSNGATTEDISGLSAGVYTLTTTDADGCTQSGSTSVSQPSALVLSLTKGNDTDPGAAGTGSIDLTVSGGTLSYSYAWTRSSGSFSENTQDLENLTAGLYTVIVTDGHGCTGTLSATIFEPEICNDGIDNDGNGLVDCYDGPCIPARPGVITPSSSSVCVGTAGVTYTVPSTATYTYNWTVPAGASITAGQGANQITVTWISNSSGQICVRAVTPSGCISATASCYTVVLNDVPPKPGTITKGL